MVLDRKIEWCLRKERGLTQIAPDSNLVLKHIIKAEHNLRAITDFNEIGYSDWSASAAFYSIYHCFLAILALFGYQSKNQECTFSLIALLIKQGKIEEMPLSDIFSLDSTPNMESPTIIGIRETEQYGIELSIDTKTLQRAILLARQVLDKTKLILENQKPNTSQ